MSVDNGNDKEKNETEEESEPNVTSSNVTPYRSYRLDGTFDPSDYVVQSPSLVRHVLIPAEQYVVGEEGTPKKVSTPRSEEPSDESVRVPVVRVRHPGRSATFYSVTEDEIDNYAQFNFLSSIALTLFGVFAGFLIGCVVALIQGSLSNTSIAVFGR